MSSRGLYIGLLASCWGAALEAVDIKPHPGRRETSTPGIVLETGARTAACDTLFFSSDGQHLLAGGDDKVIRTWSVSERGELGTDSLPTIRWPIFREVRGNIYAAALSEDQKRVAFGGNGRTSGGFAVAIADRETGQLLHGSDTPPGAQQQGAVWAIGFSPSGNRVAIGTDRGSVWVWDLPSGQFTLVGKHEPPAGGDAWYGTVRLVAFMTETEVISVCGNQEMAEWSLVQPLRKKLIHRFGGPISTPVVLSPDRQWIGAVLEAIPGSRETAVELVSFPDAQKKKRVRYLAEENSHHALPHRLAFNATSTQLAVGVRIVGNRQFDPGIKMFQERGGRVDLYALNDAQLFAKPGPTQSLYAENLAFHPKNPNWLAIAGGDHHDVAIWDLLTGKKLGEVNQPGRCVWSIAISKDGHQIAYQTERNPTANSPNQRGQGPWRGFHLLEGKFLPSVDFEVEPKPDDDRRESKAGWKVNTNTIGPNGEIEILQFWTLTSPKGNTIRLPWSRTEDEFPRCYSFLPGDEKRKVPERIVIGHYWGASVFELTETGARRVRNLRGHEGYVSALAVSEDGQRVVTASRDMTIAGWTLADWPHHPRLGAELFTRDNRLLIGQMASGSPIWELGLETGDEILSVRVPDPAHPGQAKIVYDRTTENPIGTITDLLKFFNDELSPGQEHVFYWKRPTQATIYGAITTLLDRPLWRFFPHADREWIVWQWRDYRYSASAKGDRSVGWQTSYPLAQLQTPQFHTADQLQAEFFKPDVVQSTLSLWQTEQALVQFNKLQPPQVSVSEPMATPEGYQVTISTVAQGRLETQQPERVLVWVNDHLLLDERPKIMPGMSYLRTLVVPRSKLRTGTNLISAQSYALSGARGDAQPKLFQYQPEVAAPRTLHGLFVGVNDYSRSQPKQVPIHAADDAEILSRAINRQKGKALFGQVKVKTLTNGQVTRAEVLKQLELLAEETKPDDVLILYLGGHGTSRQQLAEQKVPEALLQGLGKFLFLCGNANIRQLPDTTISFEDFHQRLVKLSCHKLVLLDTCHSGAAEVTGGNTDANPIRVLHQHGVGPVILAASAYDQQAIENNSLDPLEGGYGIFSIALRKIFEERPSFLAADQNQDNVLSTQELGHAVGTQMNLLLDEHNQFRKILNANASNEVQTPVTVIPPLEAPITILGK